RKSREDSCRYFLNATLGNRTRVGEVEQQLLPITIKKTAKQPVSIAVRSKKVLVQSQPANPFPKIHSAMLFVSNGNSFCPVESTYRNNDCKISLMRVLSVATQNMYTEETSYS
uniref:Uncharacterized protein n=1 Tax=Megaselia scalaris TaxID=36166 RepID=T1GJH6_MEGSC